MAVKAKTETFEVHGDMTIVRWFKGGAWSYDLTDSEGNVTASIWNVNKAADAWGNKVHALRGFNHPIIGEEKAIEWLRALCC